VRAVTEKILIYRPGSLGDAVVSLPCFRLVARAFPRSDRWVCTHFPKSSKAPPLAAVLEGMGLVHSFLEYPAGVSNARALIRLRTQIRAVGFRAIVYMAQRRSLSGVLRDALFFRSCGIQRLIGFPYRRGEREHRWLDTGDRHESEAERLARCLAALGDAQVASDASWSLEHSPEERALASRLLTSAFGRRLFIACNVGGKGEVKDWGHENWQALLRAVADRYSDFGLVFVGAIEESERAEELCREWLGPTLNLSGKLTPRESSAIIERAALLMGHDSGPMHLAAAAGIPCLAIFSAREKPGVWFPRGSGHRILYHQTECYGCGLDVCEKYGAKCITSISVEEVKAALDELLSSYSTSSVHARTMPAYR
jgi:heptosyltransferase III